MKKVLLAQNNSEAAAAASEWFRELGHDVTCASDGQSALAAVQQTRYDLVMTDLKLPQVNGLDLLTKIRRSYTAVPVIVFSPNPPVNEAVEAMKRGATDFWVSPLTPEMVQTVQSLLQNGCRAAADSVDGGRHVIVTRNAEMMQLLQLAEEVADSRATVFIQGESGTGKELVARHIHRCGGRSDKPFVAVNCAALPDTLLESELFGHEKGAFTGAIARKKGKFESAHEGTLLLDEISEMDMAMQAKLLRVLQEREIDRVGGVKPIPVDVRVVATTNRDIQQAVDAGAFREDLYYRLNVIPLHIPPLRCRRDDIPVLASHFIAKFNAADGKCVKGLTQEALTLLMDQPWNGNVREFENVIERAVLLCRGDRIDEQTLSLTERPLQAAADPPLPPTGASLRDMEKSMILQTLDQTNGNRTHAAEILGISVRTLRNKLSEYQKKMQAQ